MILQFPRNERKLHESVSAGQGIANPDLVTRTASLTAGTHNRAREPMSISQTNAAWQLESISFRDKLVLLALADHAKDSGICWPSVERLAKRCCLSVRSVQGALISLEKLGLIEREKRHARSTVYILKLTPQKTSFDPAESAPRTVMNPADADFEESSGGAAPCTTAKCPTTGNHAWHKGCTTVPPNRVACLGEARTADKRRRRL